MVGLETWATWASKLNIDMVLTIRARNIDLITRVLLTRAVQWKKAGLQIWV